MVRGISYGKLVEVRYLDVVPTGIESPSLAEFVDLLKQQQFSQIDLSKCRVGHVDDNGVGQYYDARAFLENEGNMDNYSEPIPLHEPAQ